jgi:branched-chain amino acid transport system permease protein
MPLLFGIILIVFGSEMESHHLSIMISIVILSIIGISYDLLFGYTGLLSFGHAAFFGVGAYVPVYLFNETDMAFGPTILVVLTVGVLLSLIVGFITLKAGGVYFAMLTLGLAQLIYLIAIRWREIGGASGMAIRQRPPTSLPIQLGNRFHFYIICLLFLVLIYIFLRRLLNSPVGNIFMAIRENEERTRMIGYNTFHYKMTSLSISGMFTTLAGSLWAYHLYIVHPRFLYWTFSGEFLLITIFGGSGTLIGPILGAGFITFAGEVLIEFIEQWRLVLGILFVTVILLFPKGIYGVISERE